MAAASGQTLWMDPQVAEYGELREDRGADVVIVGAGFSGLGAAYALRDRGLTVIVLEERTVASGASGRNAGFVLAGPAQPYGEVVAELGAEEALGIWQLTAANSRLIADLVEEWNIACGYLRRGSMSLAASEAEWGELQRTYRELQAASISASLVDADLLPRPFDRWYRGGIYYPGNAELNPGRFLRTAARRMADQAELYERTPVIELSLAGGWRVGTPRATVLAGCVILATNAYTARLADLPIAPTRGQVAATVPLPRVMVPFPLYANHGYEYWRQTPESNLVVGGWRNLDPDTEVGDEERLHPAIQGALDDFIYRVAGEEVEIAYRWAGIMGFTPDHRPLVGPIGKDSGLYLAAGYSGHGVAMAWRCGMLVARLVLGEKGEIPVAFSPDRFSATRPGARC